jgi:hypothetical protein
MSAFLRLRNLLALGTLIILLWGGLWWGTLTLARHQLEAFSARSDFHYQLMNASGSPFRIHLELADVNWVTPSGLHIVAPHLTLSLMPGNWHRYWLDSTQPIEITLKWPNQTRWSITTEQLSADITLHTNNRWKSFAADFNQLILKRTTQSLAAPETILQTKAMQLHLEQPATPPTSHLETGLSLAIALQEAHLPPDWLHAMPQQLSALTLNTRIMGSPPDWRGLPMVESWRNEGGTLELDALDFTWSNLNGRMQATLALDKDAQPQGAGTVELMLDPTIPTSADYPVFNNTISGLFGFMAKTNAATGMKTISLPIALQERQLTLGIFPITKMPEIPWGND